MGERFKITNRFKLCLTGLLCVGMAVAMHFLWPEAPSDPGVGKWLHWLHLLCGPSAFFLVGVYLFTFTWYQAIAVVKKGVIHATGFITEEKRERRLPWPRIIGYAAVVNAEKRVCRQLTLRLGEGDIRCDQLHDMFTGRGLFKVYQAVQARVAHGETIDETALPVFTRLGNRQAPRLCLLAALLAVAFFVLRAALPRFLTAKVNAATSVEDERAACAWLGYARCFSDCGLLPQYRLCFYGPDGQAIPEGAPGKAGAPALTLQWGDWLATRSAIVPVRDPVNWWWLAER